MISSCYYLRSLPSPAGREDSPLTNLILFIFFCFHRGDDIFKPFLNNPQTQNNPAQAQTQRAEHTPAPAAGGGAPSRLAQVTLPDDYI